jgi:hypothetical protein
MRFYEYPHTIRILTLVLFGSITRFFSLKTRARGSYYLKE